jgi:hypothetical protein
MRILNLVAVAAAAATTTVASATIIDNGQFGPNIGSVGGQFGSDIYAQSFVAPADNVLVQFGMWLSGGGNDAPLVSIDLWADDGFGHADENNILISGTMHQGDLPALTRIDTFTNYALTPGETYWVVINGLNDQTSQGSYNSTWDGGTDTVPSGIMEWSNDLGVTWNGIAGGDWGVYIETVVPGPGVLALLGLAGLVGRRRR